MLGNLIMLGGISLLSAGFLYRRKENYFKELYDQIERSKKFHLDFVDELGKLPVDQNLILFGPPKSQIAKDKIISTSIIKRGLIKKSEGSQSQQKKQFEFPKQDRLWKFSLKEPFYFQTLSNQKIIVEEDESTQLYAFNLMRRNSNSKWQQRVIVKNEPICAYGKILSVNGHIKFKTNLILGTKNESFLTFLDNEIMSLRSKGKLLTIAGATIFILHLGYHKAFGQEKQLIKLKTQTQKTEDDKILDQMSKFEKQNKK